MQAVTDRHELGLQELYMKGSYRQSRVHNDGLKVSKIEWTIPCPAHGVEGVNVHFESRQPGTLQLDVEIVPYEGSIEQNPGRLDQLQIQLKLKSILIEAIRIELASDPLLEVDFGASMDHLLDPSKPSALCAMKFSTRAAETTPNSDASFFSRLIDRATPMVDKAVRQARHQSARL
jgi:hypothetical protein